MTDHSAARDAHRERESLVDAAWRQIAAHGSDLSTEQADEQIAADAGVSVERLHHHFPSGPDLALGVVDRLYSEMMALRLRCTDGWGTQQQAQVTWRNFVHDVAGLGMGDIFARVTPETVRVLGPELRSAAIPPTAEDEPGDRGRPPARTGPRSDHRQRHRPQLPHGDRHDLPPGAYSAGVDEPTAAWLVDRHLPARHASGVKDPLPTAGENG